MADTSPRPRLRPGPTKTGRMTVRNRPVWQNPLTKEVYSEKTVTIPWGTGYATVPSVDGQGNELSREELYKRIVNVKTQLSKKGPVDFITGEDLPVFDTEEDAIKYAMWRSSTMFDKEASDQGFQLDQYELAPEKEDPSFLYDMGSYGKKIAGSLGALGLRKLGFDAYPTENSFAEGGVSMLPAVDDDRTPSRPRDTFNPLAFAKESWESAKENFRDAGVTEVDLDDPALYNGYIRAVDYLKDSGLAGLDLIDAAAKAVIGTAGELVTRSDASQRRFQRDIYSMPEAFAGAAGARSVTQLDDAIEAGAESARLAKAASGPLAADAVGQTRALLSGDTEFLRGTPTDRTTTQSLSAGFTGQNPPTYLERDIPLSQQEDFEPVFNEDGVIKHKGIPSEKTQLRKDNILQFREPIAEFAKTVTIPKKGLLGSEFLKMIKKNESIADSSLQTQIIDPKRRYTREELLEAIGLQDQYPGPNVFESNAYINNTMGGERYGAYQRQGKDAGFLDIGEELSYFEIPITSYVPSGFEGTGKNFKANSQHFEAGTIAHVRGSIVQPHNLEESGFIGTIVSDEYERLTGFGKKPFLLVEEIQSDLLQKGYAKPSSLTDAAFNKAAEAWSRNNYVSFQETFGEISKDIKNIFEELDEVGIVRPDLVDGFSARDTFQRNAVERGYVLSNELEEVLDKLNVSEQSIQTTVMDLTDLARGRDLNQYLPIVDVDTGAEFSIADFTERFKKEKYFTPQEKMQKFFDKSRELLANKKIDKEIDFNDFQNLYASYKTNQFRLARGGYHDDIGLPPITKNKQAVEEALKTLIAKAGQSDVDKIVIPPAERIAYARGRDIDPKNKGDRFYRTYVSDLDKALKDLEKNYPVKVHRDVELPYERKERMIDETEATANFYEVATDFIRENLIEHEGISVPQDIDLEALNSAADKERFLSPLSAEEDAAFRAFAKHNQISLDEAGDAFDNWFDGQLRHLQGIDGFDEIQESLSTQVSNKGIILDVSELVDKYKVEQPRQFARGGMVDKQMQDLFAGSK